MLSRILGLAVVLIATCGSPCPLAAQSRGQAAEWGALGHTEDGTYAAASKVPTLAEAHRKVTSECAAFERGTCEVVTFPGQYCAALATYAGPDPDKRTRYSRYAVDRSPEVAQRLALTKCAGAASAGRDQCEIKGVVCGDGRAVRARLDGGSPRSSDADSQRAHDSAALRSDEPDAPRRTDPDPSRSSYFGAIGFTADGSWATVWKMDSRAEAEANVAKRCAKFGRGSCEVVAFPGERCVGLATFIGRAGRTRWKLSFTGGGMTGPDAQRTAMDRCNSDNRTRGQCQLRTMVCGDGR